ncbi:MAG: tetratricopeptide repeat protein [Lentisphaerae bacterium]|nr:tetratricopeptide repeat protein [Lentisphaerota bacterium]
MSHRRSKHPAQTAPQNPLAPAAASRFNLHLPGLLFLVLATGFAYASSVHVPFIFDDDLAIVQNMTIRHLADWREVLHPPSGGATTHGRPIVNLSLAVNYALGALNPVGYHLFNLMIHLLNGLLVWGLGRRILATGNSKLETRPQETAGSGLPPRAHQPVAGKLPVTSFTPFAIALLWLLHPLCTQAVTYIVQRAESMAACFYLLTLYGVARAAVNGDSKLETGSTRAIRPVGASLAKTSSNNRSAQARPLQPDPSPSLGRRAWSCAAVVACALGMATKETMVSAPLVALLLDHAFLAGREASPRGASAPLPPGHPSPFRLLWRERGRLHLALCATWLIQLVIQMQPAVSRGTNTGFGAGVSAFDYLITESAVIAHYLRLAIWPDTLCFDYRWPIATSITAVWPQLLLVASLLLGSIWLWFRRPRLAFPLLAFFLILAPTSSILPIADVAAEHRMYLPMVPLLALTLCGAVTLTRNIRKRLCRRRGQLPPSGDGATYPLAATAALLAVALLLGARTYLRNLDYQSDVGLWQDTIDKRPANGRAWYNRGYLHQQAGRSVAAIRDYEYSMAIAPEMPGPYYNRGNLRMEAGRVEDAIADYTAGIAREEGNAMLYYNRGIAYVQTGRMAEAITDFTACTRLSPRMAAAYYQRADTLARLDRYTDAVADYSRAIQYNPSLVDAYHNRAAAYAMLGQLDAARLDIIQCRRLGSEPSPDLLQMIESPTR